ncbi:hypothetical protein [Streptomyces sp. NPDC058579]|uniref:hypothetical protein n=1 Tax=Streptomyces sp. NPDC058579 TaxID=3346548 RepID=UPI00365F03DA
MDLLLDAVRDGVLSTSEAQALARYHISDGIPDAEAAARAGTTADRQAAPPLPCLAGARPAA